MIVDFKNFKKKATEWRKTGMIDYIMVGALILVLLLNFAGMIWSTVRNNKQQEIQSGAIYCLYQELHRYNDNQFGNAEAGK